jgi:DNA invertase Pin-like site-specific DNA recombinase
MAAGMAMLQMCRVFAEFERSMIVQRINAGLARANVSRTTSSRKIGRPEPPEGAAGAIRPFRHPGLAVTRAGIP